MNHDDLLSFAEFTAAGHAMSIHPLPVTGKLELLDMTSKAILGANAHARASAFSQQRELSRILAPKGDCCFRDEVAANNRCYPVCKAEERLVTDNEKVFCADKDCPAQATCKTALSGNGFCLDVCVHCTKTCPPDLCSTDFCATEGQNGCWYKPAGTDAHEYLCDIGVVTGGVYYEEPVPRRLNVPIGDPRPCSSVYWSDDTLKPRGA